VLLKVFFNKFDWLLKNIVKSLNKLKTNIYNSYHIYIYIYIYITFEDNNIFFDKFLWLIYVMID